MSQLHVRQIKSRLERTFNGLIDISDVSARPKRDQDDAFLSRSLSAYALCVLAEAEPSVAATHVVDGFGDNGIDAVYFDSDGGKLFVVQSKWIHSGSGSPELGDIHKTLAGFRDLVNGEFGKFNSKTQALSPSIEVALDDPATKICLVFAYTGLQELSAEANRPISEVVSNYNDVSDLVEVVTFNQKILYQAISGAADGSPINFEAMVHEWGQVREPYFAIYGQVRAEDVARWPITGGKLFNRNLRKIIYGSDVNKQISNTLRTAPADFWYFNNGITVLCQKIQKKPIGGDDRSNGVFVFEGASVVNGAQTVGSVTSAYSLDPEKVKTAKVLVRFISLENCPEDFAVQVTRATNTQNRIESRDFAALDPEQERLRREMHLDGKTYAYKTGDAPPPAAEGCTIEDATIALACAYSEVGLAVTAKSQIGKLWENIEKPPYKLIFNGSVTSRRLWNSVELLRSIDESLKSYQQSLGGKLRQITVHGNRFVAHEVFKRLPVARFDEPDLNLEECKVRAVDLTRKVVDATHEVISNHFGTSYLQSLFKNATKCKVIDAELASIPALNAQS